MSERSFELPRLRGVVGEFSRELLKLTVLTVLRLEGEPKIDLV